MNLCKCLRCGKVMIDEEYTSHICNQPVNGKIVKIYADYRIEGKHPETGEKLISVRAIDGTAYWIIFPKESEMNKLPFEPSDENLQAEDSDADLTEPPKLVLLYYYCFDACPCPSSFLLGHDGLQSAFESNCCTIPSLHPSVDNIGRCRTTIINSNAIAGFLWVTRST